MNYKHSPDTWFPYECDVTRIQEAFILLGHTISAEDAKLAWEDYSDTYSAGWLYLPNGPEDIFHCLQPYIEEAK